MKRIRNASINVINCSFVMASLTLKFYLAESNFKGGFILCKYLARPKEIYYGKVNHHFQVFIILIISISEKSQSYLEYKIVFI